MLRCFFEQLPKRRVLAVILFTSFSSFVFSLSSYAQSGVKNNANSTLWVTPTFATSAPIKESITVESTFNYHLYTPLKGQDNVRLVRRKYSSMSSAEDALIARISAVSSVNYQWWLDTWHKESKKIALPFFQQKGFDQTYWEDTWKKQFKGRKIKLKHKVIYQGYVVLIYNVSEPSGKEGFLDLPIVFKKEDDKWLVSLDIRQSPLLRFSPWVEGIDSEKVIYE
jgi:hypothetical protein